MDLLREGHVWLTQLCSLQNLTQPFDEGSAFYVVCKSFMEELFTSSSKVDWLKNEKTHGIKDTWQFGSQISNKCLVAGSPTALILPFWLSIGYHKVWYAFVVVC